MNMTATPPTETSQVAEPDTRLSTDENDGFWSNCNVTHHYQFSTASDSLEYFNWRNDQYLCYLDLMPVDAADGLSVLDYGCGPGHDLVGFGVYSKPKRLIGIDVSEPSLGEARHRLALHGIQAQLTRLHPTDTRLPLASNSIDLIHCSGVLHHVPRPDLVLKEFRRVLKPGGRAQIMVYNYDSVFLHLYVAYKKMIVEGLYRDLDVAAAFGKLTDGDTCPISIAYKPHLFIKLADQTGFKTRFLGAAISAHEMALLPARFDAIMDRRLPAEHRRFLSSLSLSDRGLPLYNGMVAGVDGCFELVLPSSKRTRTVGGQLEGAPTACAAATGGEMAMTSESRDPRARRKLNILVLYDDHSTHIMTVREHLQAFAHHSKNNVFFLPATLDHSSPIPPVAPSAWDFSCFDAVILHYSVRLNYPDHFAAPLAKRLAEFDGLKLLFIQDEYDNVELVRRNLDRLQFDIVFTCVPEESIGLVYPRERFARTEFIPTLTGYVPDHDGVESFATPMEDRKIHIGYRGRDLPPLYGRLGRDKFRIGIDMRRLAAERGVPVDIELSSEKRIYGTDWYRFLGSCRATLGTESGSNIFDFSGELWKLSQANSDRPYDEVYKQYFEAHEGPVRMNQISPKVFEAIRLRTALLLFEGEYSGVIKPREHYIPLKEDYSNVDEVFALLEDVAYLNQLTERAYRDVVLSETYSYARFVAGVDRHIDDRVLTPPRAELICVPLLRRRRVSDEPELVSYRDAHDFALNTAVLGGDLPRATFADLVAVGSSSFPFQRHSANSAAPEAVPAIPDPVEAEPPNPGPAEESVSIPAPVVRMERLAGSVGIAARLLPLRLRRRIAYSLKDEMDRYHRSSEPLHSFNLGRALWRLLPRSVREAVTARLRAIT